jgi:hypothetical protein
MKTSRRVETESFVWQTTAALATARRGFPSDELLVDRLD